MTPVRSHRVMRLSILRLSVVGLSTLALAACDANGNLDFDMRDAFGSGADTTDAAFGVVQPRPEADPRGVISYPTYQVAVAQRGDTLGDVAARVGLPAGELASFNGSQSDTPLREGEVIALPRRVGEPTAVGTDIAGIASSAIDRAPDDSPRPAGAPTVESTPLIQDGPEPIQHRVARGETAFTIARLYNVPVGSLAEWNGLGPDLVVREGEILLIPVVIPEDQSADASGAVTGPGSGSPTPTPPSAARPQPRDDTRTAEAPAPAAPSNTAIGATAAAPKAAMSLPVKGDIIRTFTKGRNEGINIAAPAGSAVVAAQSGVVANITEDTRGTTILVLKHDNNLLTAYAGIEDLTIKEGDTVSRDQRIASVSEGEPSNLRFSVFDGTTLVDPARYLGP